MFPLTWYDAGLCNLDLSPDFKVWLKSSSAQKYTVSFVNTATQILYCELEGGWSLAGPHLFAAGKLSPSLSNLDSHL